MTDPQTHAADAVAEVPLTPEEEAAFSLGVVRHMNRTYAVGDYRYTTLSDAVAHARHLAKTADTEA